MVLRNAGLIADRKEGLRVYYHIQDSRVVALLDEVNALTTARDAMNSHVTLAACTCPKCEAHREVRAR